MTTNYLDPASFAWGLALGVTIGLWLRGRLDIATAGVRGAACLIT
jgi:hypothetical protein